MPPILPRQTAWLLAAVVCVTLLSSATPTWADEGASPPPAPAPAPPPADAPSPPPPAAPAPAPASDLTPPPESVAPAEPPSSLPPAGSSGGALAGAAGDPGDGDPAASGPPAAGTAKVQDNVHSVGLALSFSTGSGFAYRRAWGPTSVQLSAFAVVTDRGDSTILAVGGLFAQRVHVWRGSGRTILPSTSALRVLGGADYFLSRSISNSTVDFGPSCLVPSGCPVRTTNSTGYFNAAGGLGFEFGAIDHAGVSLTLDVVLTASFKDGGFSFLLPLPQLAVLYNW